MGFAETALELVNERETKEIENVIQLVFDASSDAGKLRRHVKRVHECKRKLDDSRDEELAKESFAKGI